MAKPRYRVPSTAALVAFEAAARHCNFSRAAEELNTSQSAISRHIAGLEARFGASLFERRHKKLSLTEQGDHFYRAVVSGLDSIQTAAGAIAHLSGSDQLTIACTHEISHLFLMPRFEALQAAVGEAIQIRILTCEYDALEAEPDPRIDLMFAYGELKDRTGQGGDGADSALVFREAVMPLASPVFAAANEADLSRGPAAWGGLPFLKLTKPNRGWATWEEWFARAGAPAAAPRYLWFDNYVYLLEAAAAGRGLALGWRGLTERYQEAGSLTAVTAEAVTFERGLHALLTRRGRDRPAARACLAFLRAAGPAEGSRLSSPPAVTLPTL